MAVEDKEIILLKFLDKTARCYGGLTAVLATYNAIILDIGQDIHETCP
jgi:hypothetical protein